MRKLTPLLIAGTSLFTGGMMTTPAAASPIIVDAPNPSTCELYKDRELEGTCDGFRLVRVRDESIPFDGFNVEFQSGNLNVTYLAVINDNSVTEESNGQPVTFYPTLTMTIEQPGFEPETSTIDGTCGIASDYSRVVCASSDATYLYVGEPVISQQNPSIAPSRNSPAPANVDNYVFSTNSHVNTGVSVNPGDRVTVQASGTIRFGFFAGSGGPRGIFLSPDYNYFIDLLHGQLMGRVREFGMQDFDGWFPVGEGTEIVVQSPGVLEFAVNDNQPGDNAGSFRIEVTIDSSQN